MPKRKRSEPTSVDSAGPCYLLDLPVELVEYIVEYLWPDNLLPLRRTCKALEALVTPDIAVRCFFDRSFMLADEESMQALRQITSREAFAKRMYRIRLTNGTARTYVAPRDRKICEGRARSRRVLRNLKDIRETEKVFRSRGGAIGCLAGALRNLMAVNKTPAIVCSGNEIRDKRYRGVPLGYRRLREALDNETCIGDCFIDGVSYAIVMDALYESGFPVTSLEMGSVHAGVPLRLYGCRQPDYQYLQSLNVDLDVEMSEYTDDEAGDAARARDMKGLISVLRVAQGIEHFEFGVWGQRYAANSQSGPFAAIAAARAKGLILPRLRFLNLDSHTIQLPVLLAFLESYSYKQLRTIKLWRIRDGAADYHDLNQRIYRAMGVPESFAYETIHDGSHVKERRGHYDFYLTVFECYNGDYWIQWDLETSHRVLLGLGDQQWPRPWPELELDD